MILPSGVCHRSLLFSNQPTLMRWLGAASTKPWSEPMLTQIRGPILRLSATIIRSSFHFIWCLMITPLFYLYFVLIYGVTGLLHGCINPPSSTAYMRQYTGSALLQVMSCCRSGAKPLPKFVQNYCHMNPEEQISVKFQSKLEHFRSGKYVWKCRLWKCPHIVQGEMG